MHVNTLNINLGIEKSKVLEAKKCLNMDEDILVKENNYKVKENMVGK